ncbi:phosphopentomutase [uncultured Desulfuromonas sp.]|uniref:phosphopentomutase n=1 Tax=uncultured Desulfuromonas sp. TaxID=181013 RepID=UPI002AABC933|nr:phosphopentomutase [uncultured Desulfuromonas sp.]
MLFKRVVLIVLDGVGCGALPDAELYGDSNSNTLAHIAEQDGALTLPTLQRLGLGNLVTMKGVPVAADPQGAWGRMAERSAGKDSTTGHWEIAGAILDQPFATFAKAFPEPIIQAFTELAGVEPLGNVIASGTEILVELGEEHLRTGRPIVYTSTDSVFQIAAHEDLWPPEKLYELCRGMRQVLNDWQVGRVIARPFVGDRADNFRRTERRHDFSMQPQPMILDDLAEHKIDVVAVGKIQDIFCGRGISKHYPTRDNADGMEKITAALQEMERGLIFANLIDYDMLYGHRCDVVGFARALERFDQWLSGFLKQLGRDDLLLITADHGCDPTMPGTDHSREYVPLLAWSPSLTTGCHLGDRETFSDIAATLGEIFAIETRCGNSFLSTLTGC